MSNKMEESREALLPCPFCGGSAELRTTSGWSGVGCNTDKCPAYLHALMFRTPFDARARWNRRSPPKGEEAAEGVPEPHPLQQTLDALRLVNRNALPSYDAGLIDAAVLELEAHIAGVEGRKP